MSRSNSADFSPAYRANHEPDDSNQAADAVEHNTEDKAEHKAHYQPEKNGDGQSVGFITRFNHELRGIDDRAAAVFDPKGNISDYSAEDRHAFVDAYVTAFNNVAPSGLTTERWQAAKETSDLVFKPLYNTTELKEAVGYAQIDPTVANALEENDVKLLRYITNTPDENGESIDYNDVKYFDFQVDSIEQAQKIMEATGGEAYIVDTTALDLRREEFTALLYASSADQDTASNYMSNVLDDAIAYTNAEEFTNPEPTTFANILEQDDPLLRDNLIAANIRFLTPGVRRSLDDLSRSNPDESLAAHTAAQAHFETYHSGMTQMVDANSEETYNRSLQTLEKFDTNFTRAVENNTGFIKAEQYQQPDLPESFNTLEDASKYLNAVQETMTGLNQSEGDIDPVTYLTLSNMANDFDHLYENVGGHSDNDEWSIDNLQPAADHSDTLSELHNIAKGMNYILKPYEESTETGQSQPDREPAPVA